MAFPSPKCLELLGATPRADVAKPFGYGTAGFRTEASLLDAVMLRMGMLATLRSKHKGGLVVGLMVTASHNPEVRQTMLTEAAQRRFYSIGSTFEGARVPRRDNGVKMVDSDGGMLDMSWEKHAEALANAMTPEEVGAALEAIVAEEGIKLEETARVFMACDTRSSSKRLIGLSIEGALSVGGNVADFGLLTTPQLHHMVYFYNQPEHRRHASEEGYYALLVEKYQELLAAGPSAAAGPAEWEARGATIVDCANGVGSIALVGESKDGEEAKAAGAAATAAAGAAGKLAERLAAAKLLTLEVRNKAGTGTLNEGCGAEHVQKGRLCPGGFAAGEVPAGQRCCSFDGDADRIVYHYYSEDGQWHLLDGDKIATLWAVFLKELLDAADAQAFTMGVVQTAYANGSSGAYMRQAGCTIALAKTGVKYVHAAACGHHGEGGYDVGLYFEANGHGTVIFKPALVEHLQKVVAENKDKIAGDEAAKAKHSAAKRLLATQRLVNQAVGDAITNMLFTEAVLTIKGWTLEDWDKFYADLPSRQTKQKVKDRTVVVCTPDETRTTAPDGMQKAIDEAAAAIDKSARAFVRPSGTEDVVRVYAESETEEGATKLANQIVDIIYEHAQGVGDKASV